MTAALSALAPRRPLIRRFTRQSARTARTPAAAAALLFVVACAPGEQLGPSSGVLAVAVDRAPAAGEWALVTVGGAPITSADTVLVNDTTQATVDPDGRLFAKGSGPVTVTVRRPGAEGSAVITLAPRPAQQFTITWDFQGWTPTPAERAAFDRVAARLQTVLQDVDGPVDVDLGRSGCFTQHGVLPGVQGLVVQVQRGALGYDDGTGADIGEGGTCFLAPNGLAAVAMLTVSDARLAQYQQQGTWQAYRALEEVVLHEVGHGMGLAGLMGGMAPVDKSDLAHPQFTGANAVAGYAAVGGSGAVPLKAGDVAHWGTTLGNDVMQSTAHPERRLSPISLGALKDLGYAVNLSRAERAVPVTHGASRVR